MQEVKEHLQHVDERKSHVVTDYPSQLIAELNAEGIEIFAPINVEYYEILSPDALRFVARLARRFSEQREILLKRRADRQLKLDQGILPDFLPETAHIRTSNWKVDPVPADLVNRRVEITGPAGDTKMVINALNSGANIYMADFEDAQSPTWENTIRGQINLRNAIYRTISFQSTEGKRYELGEKVATLMVRPRGWHLTEKHIHVDGHPISASLFDFGLFFFHNAIALLTRGTQPYFYLPKLENHLEARLWNDVFLFAQDEFGIPSGTIKATVLIETILAAFEMEEILYELRVHSAGLNCGRWDYIFSFIKKFHSQPRFALPDRSQVTMEKNFLSSYVRLLIKTCHKRNAYAIGGMAAQIPIKNNDYANGLALEKVRLDKEREVGEGHDGTWVAHPGLVNVARSVFDEGMKTENQLHILREDVNISAANLLQVPPGTITEAGLRTNIDVGIQYLEAWLNGIGAVPLYNLMEDAATAEISRAQVWQWIHHNAMTDDGRQITSQMVHKIIKEELEKIRCTVGENKFYSGKYHLATSLFERIVSDEEFEEFITVPAYEYL